MKKRKIKLVIFPLIIGLIGGIILSIFYHYLAKTEIENTINRHIETSLNNSTKEFTKQIHDDYLLLTMLSPESLDFVIDDQHSPFIEIYDSQKVKNQNLLKNNINIVQENQAFDSLNDQMVIAFKKPISGNNKYIIAKLDSYLNGFYENQNIIDFYLADDQLGMITTSNQESKEYVYDYFDGTINENKDKIDYIINNPRYAQSITINQKKYLITSTKITIEDLEIFSIYQTSLSISKKILSSIQLMTLITFLTSFLITTVGLIVFVYFNKNQTRDMMLSLRKISGSSDYVIVTDLKGRIKSSNVYAEEDFETLSKCQFIYQLFEDNSHQLEDGLSFLKTYIGKVKFKDDYHMVRFFITSTKNRFIFLGEDFTNEYIEKQKLQQLVFLNPVTNRLNLVALKKELEELASEKKLKDQSFIIAIDIDHFAEINRVFGRSVGDMVLKYFANRIEENVEEHIEIFNSDGDNFFLFGKFINNPEQYAIKIVEELIEVFASPLKIYTNLILVKIKAGIYAIEDNNINSEKIISNVNMALKSAKLSRQLFYETYDVNVGRRVSREMKMQVDMVNAVKQKEFVLFYQPQYDLSKKKVCGFEALIRWANPQYISESPMVFIEMAEKNDLIIEIGRFVIDEAFKTAKKYEKEDISISINVSPVQLMQSGFVMEIARAIEKYQVNPSKIAIEITETIMMELYDVIIDKLKQLRSLGFEIHLDDFGTGYSSLLYLNSLPITTIKIDKEFIKNMANDQTRMIVTSVISMANNLGYQIIAEGVETDKESQFIEKAGCKVIQGYVISKAVAESEIMNIINKFNQLDSPIIGLKNKKKEMN